MAKEIKKESIYRKAFVYIAVFIFLGIVLSICANAQDKQDKDKSSGIIQKIGEFFQIIFDQMNKRYTGYALLGSGGRCTSNDMCESGNCKAGVCCIAGKQCCSEDYDCDGAFCDMANFFCFPKASNGETCSLNSNCQSNNCYNGVCCMADRICCTATSQCSSGYKCNTLWNFCEESAPVCGDGSCNGQESCSPCSQDCGQCPEAKKSNGQSCSSSSECTSGYCVHSVCRSSSTYCGDSYCDTGESCTSCSNDCGACQTTKKSNGQPCSSNSDCSSGNCKNYICCESGKTCCYYNSDCSSGYSCGNSYYCIASAAQQTNTKKSNGYSCSSNSDCNSENCNNWMCCEYEKTCCNSNSQCNSGYYCGNDYHCELETTTNTETKKTIGQSCYSSSECLEGTCIGGICNCNDRNGDAQCDVPQLPCETAETTTDNTNSINTKPKLLPATGIVISVLPHGGEGEKVKKLIEEDIYPAISDMFVDNREIDANINLVVSDKESVAQWDEKTNTLTVPYEFSYENFLDYPRDIIQRNGIAHELTHYLLNGLAIENGGDYKRVPLWLREGIAEYGAHEYMMFYSGNGMNNSISQVRSDIFADYLMNKNYNYKETVEKNAIKKISWNDYNFEDIESKDHVYYGAAFSFVKYWLQNTNRTVYYPATATPLVELREIFISISTKKLKADGVFSDKEKSNWFKAVNNQLKIKQKLDNKPCSWWEKIFGCKRE